MREFIVFTLQIGNRLNTVPHGEANGYVAVPPESKIWGEHYDDINYQMRENVHGGLTLSEQGESFLNENIEFKIDLPEDFDKWYVYGFDTVHPEDNLINWPTSAVYLEAEKLKKTLYDLELERTILPNSVWKNNKTGDLYLVNAFPIYNATTNTPTEEQNPFVFYSPISNPRQKWVREAWQFIEKFTYHSLYENFLKEALTNYEERCESIDDTRKT